MLHHIFWNITILLVLQRMKQHDGEETGYQKISKSPKKRRRAPLKKLPCCCAGTRLHRILPVDYDSTSST
jgi:hypothetical protein